MFYRGPVKITWTTAARDLPPPVAAAEAALLTAGGPFELEDGDVLGERMAVFRRRARSLRDFVAASAGFGDAEHLVFVGGTANEVGTERPSPGAISSERRFTFADHLRRVASTAAALRDRFGVGPGDRVAIAAANTPEWLVTFWATVSLGAVAVGLNAWWTGAELRYALDDAAPKLLVADRRRLARLGESGLPTVAIEDGFDALWNHDPGAGLPDAPIDEDDPAVILYTSGTTGRPKGAVHSHRNLIALVGLNFFHGARLRGLRGGPPAAPCMLISSPLFHVSGLHSAAVSALAGGIKTVWTQGRFDPAVLLALIERERVTSWGYTATGLHRLLAHPALARTDVSSLVQLGGGGSPIAPALQERTRALLPGLAASFGVGYGLTECTALAALAFGDDLRAHPASVGRPLPTVEIEIRDATGAPVAEGVDGEIHVRSPLVMREYWRNPAATAEAIGPGRWLRTGDLGRIEGGRLYLTSRRRDLILRGGENVYPVEIEQRLEQHPDVAEAAVIGVDHPDLGQEVKAIVVARAGARLDPEALARWAAETLAYFKVPAQWEIRDAPLPRNATGKVLKQVLAGDDAGFLDE